MKVQVSSAVLLAAAFASFGSAASAQSSQGNAPRTAWEASRAQDDDSVITTGVARARDRLDSATSTSSFDDSNIEKVGSASLSDILRNVPGLRSEASAGEALSNVTIRGLPMVSTGIKYIQLQEDGLPVLEFGDFLVGAPDLFMRADFNLAQIESIRGGSASTFASNAPGGVINFISKTGEFEGGSIQASTGLNFDLQRTDFDYGGRLSDNLRFHVGGFFRQGEGVRETGYTGNRGGQLKFNVTREFEGGFFRVEGKLLDDRVSPYMPAPMRVTGSNSDPSYESLPNFSITEDATLSRNISVFPILDETGNLSQVNMQDGIRSKVKSIGFQTRFRISDWSISNNMRISSQSGSQMINFPFAVVPATAATFAFGSPFGSLAYATGPQAGQAITSPGTLNGNGLVLYSGAISSNIRSLDNFTNDLRASRVWDVGGGELTTTAGVYNSVQDFDMTRRLLNHIQDVRGGGNSSLINLVNANGTPNSQGGALNFSGPSITQNRNFDVQYRVLAPYGSLNFRRGKVSVGGSIRFDEGQVEGTVAAARPGDIRAIDVNNDGILSTAERSFAFVPASNSQPVNYDYSYTSYSASINYRLSESFSSFARYSSGARAGADRILLTPAISNIDGSLVNADAAYDPVKQAELGMKFRRGGIFANFTGFSAEVSETNGQIRQGTDGNVSLQLVTRSYEAYGAELEAGFRRGGFSVVGSATVTDAEIVEAESAVFVGNTPRRQAKLIYQFLPQYETDLYTVGASIVGTTGSFAQDENLLEIPGYTTVNAFVQFRPMDRVVLSLNANNLFDELAITDVSAPTLPASGVVLAQTLYGRSLTAAVRFYF